MQHLLIVEDSCLVTDALRLLFEAHGYRVSIANSVALGFEYATNDPADVMLLDLSLPDGNGLDLLHSLRRAGTLPLATLAVTGWSDDVTRERCLAAGCRAVLEKPVPIQELLARVQAF